jgi:hypothetical protein
MREDDTMLRRQNLLFLPTTFWMAKSVDFSVAAEADFFRGFSVRRVDRCWMSQSVAPCSIPAHGRRSLPNEHTPATEHADPSKPHGGKRRERSDPLPFVVAAYMPQQKILDDEFPLAGPQRTAASTARYLTTGFWASLNLDDVVERAAMRTLKKRLARGRNRFAPSRHGTPARCCNEQ